MSRISKDEQSIEEAEVGEVSAVFGTSIDPSGEPDGVSAAPVEQPNKPETPLETLQRAITQLESVRTWALAKAQSIEDRIAAAGGEPSAAVKEAIAKLRDLAQD